MQFILKDLLPADQRLLSAQLHESIFDVINVMHEHDYDQLPVVANDGKTSLKQVVTFECIIQAIQSFGADLKTLQVRDVAQNARTFGADADLLATLDDIQKDNFALIVDDSNILTGIVTTADTTVFFREYAQDLMEIEGIESRIKEAIKALYKMDEAGLRSAIEAVTDRASEIRKRLPQAIKAYLVSLNILPPGTGTDISALADAERRLGLSESQKDFDKLTMDEFIHVLLRHPNAPKLSRANDVSELRIMLESVRNARNKLAHFRGELDPAERRTIRFAAKWLERNLPEPLAEEPTPSHTPSRETTTSPPDFEDEEVEPKGTYALLAKYLAEQANSHDSIPLTFKQIETILNAELPRSAFEYRAWWANDPTKPQAMAWLGEGWRTTSLNLAERRLLFVLTSDRENSYMKFFGKLNARLEKEVDFPLRHTASKGQSWITLCSLNWHKTDGACINGAFSRGGIFRIELYIDSGDKILNKWSFAKLAENQGAIETRIGEPLKWEPLNEKRACRIAVYHDSRILNDPEDPVLVEWAATKAAIFYRTFRDHFRP